MKGFILKGCHIYRHVVMMRSDAKASHYVVYELFGGDLVLGGDLVQFGTTVQSIK